MEGILNEGNVQKHSNKKMYKDQSETQEVWTTEQEQMIEWLKSIKFFNCNKKDCLANIFPEERS